MDVPEIEANKYPSNSRTEMKLLHLEIIYHAFYYSLDHFKITAYFSLLGEMPGIPYGNCITRNHLQSSLQPQILVTQHS